jgi:hypothetical protein
MCPTTGRASIPPPWRLPVPFGESVCSPLPSLTTGDPSPTGQCQGCGQGARPYQPDLRGGQLERNRVMANPDYTDLVAAQRAYFLTIQVAI